MNLLMHDSPFLYIYRQHVGLSVCVCVCVSAPFQSITFSAAVGTDLPGGGQCILPVTVQELPCSPESDVITRGPLASWYTICDLSSI